MATLDEDREHRIWVLGQGWSRAEDECQRLKAERNVALFFCAFLLVYVFFMIVYFVRCI